jgi:large subunit ribosomal protein L23
MKIYHKVIKKTIFTETVTKKIAATNQYSFEVDRKANKIEIRRAVEEAFNLKNKVISVNTMNVNGKYKRIGRKGGYRPNWKKALVTLVKGVKIENVFPEA